VATVREVVASVATPELLSVCGEPRGEPPSMNWTLPVGVAELPDDILVTVAVNVTDWPKNEGLLFDVTAVEVLALFTVSAPLPVAESADTPAFVAFTVNAVATAGVAEVVLMVSVEVFEASPEANERELGLNDGVAPLGNDVVRLRLAVKAALVPEARLTVTV
jgi:hypothetical protein